MVEFYAAHRLIPLLVSLWHTHPHIRVEIGGTNGSSDLLQHGADIAIPNFRPTGDELIARRRPEGAAAFHATPAVMAAGIRAAP